MIYAYNKVQSCLSLLVWLLGVEYVSCTSYTACSKGHRLLGSLLWGYAATSIIWGVGPSVQAFNRAVHKLRHAKEAVGGGGGVISSVTMYALKHTSVWVTRGGGRGVKFHHFCVTSFVDGPNESRPP